MFFSLISARICAHLYTNKLTGRMKSLGWNQVREKKMNYENTNSVIGLHNRTFCNTANLLEANVRREKKNHTYKRNLGLLISLISRVFYTRNDRRSQLEVGALTNASTHKYLYLWCVRSNTQIFPFSSLAWRSLTSEVEMTGKYGLRLSDTLSCAVNDGELQTLPVPLGRGASSSNIVVQCCWRLVFWDNCFFVEWCPQHFALDLQGIRRCY